MRLRVTDDAPTNLSFPYTGRLEPGDEFAVDGDKGAALRDAHDFLEAVEPAADDDGLNELTKSELYDRATEADIEGRSAMDKGELVDALRED